MKSETESRHLVTPGTFLSFPSPFSLSPFLSPGESVETNRHRDGTGEIREGAFFHSHPQPFEESLFVLLITRHRGYIMGESRWEER